MVADHGMVGRFLGATNEQLFGLGVEYPVYRVFIRDQLFRIIDELTDWIELSFVIRFNAVGTWRLRLHSNSVSARLIGRNCGIVVKRDNITIFSGQVSSEWAWSAKEFTCAGRDDNAFLEMLGRPVPSQNTGPWGVEYFVQTAQATTAMRTLVEQNMGALAPSMWRIPNFTTGDDPHLGGTVTLRVRFDPIITILQEVAVAPITGGLRFRVLQSDVLQNKVTFHVSQPVDRSASAKFSTDLGTASDFSYVYQQPEGNYFYVAGGDALGRNRTILEGGDAASIAEVGRRIGRWIDRRGVTSPAELQQSLAEALAGAVSSVRVTITPFSLPSLQWGTHWDVGDLAVFSSSQSGTITDLVRELEVSLDPRRGAILTPMIGEPNTGNDDQMATYINAVRNRVEYLQKNWNIPPDSIDRSMMVPVMKPLIGEVKWMAGPTVPLGYISAHGQVVERASWPLLFSHIGVFWNTGSETASQFRLPDLRGRFPMGAGGSFVLGQTGGSESGEVGNHSHPGAPHTHPGSHSHGTVQHDHTGPPHTHPGSHSHGFEDVSFEHFHQLDLDHDHDAQPTGGVDSDPVAVGYAAPAGGTTDHHHVVDIPALGETLVSTTGVDGDSTLSGSTDPDTNAPPASYTGNTGLAAPNTEPDSNVFPASYTGAGGEAGEDTFSTLNPYAALNPVIYAGE
jgi:microcystin-dependent protein